MDSEEDTGRPLDRFRRLAKKASMVQQRSLPERSSGDQTMKNAAERICKINSQQQDSSRFDSEHELKFLIHLDCFCCFFWLFESNLLLLFVAQQVVKK